MRSLSCVCVWLKIQTPNFSFCVFESLKVNESGKQLFRSDELKLLLGDEKSLKFHSSRRRTFEGITENWKVLHAKKEIYRGFHLALECLIVGKKSMYRMDQCGWQECLYIMCVGAQVSKFSTKFPFFFIRDTEAANKVVKKFDEDSHLQEILIIIQFIFELFSTNCESLKSMFYTQVDMTFLLFICSILSPYHSPPTRTLPLWIEYDFDSMLTVVGLLWIIKHTYILIRSRSEVRKFDNPVMEFWNFK